MAKNKQYIRQRGKTGGFRGREKEEQEELERQQSLLQEEEGSGDDTLIDLGEEIEHVQDFYEKHSKTIVAVVAGLVLLAGAYLAYKYFYKAPREKAGLEAMYKAENQFQKDSFALALENPGAGFEGFLDIIDNYSGTKAANLSKYYAGISYLNLGKYEDAIEYLKSYSAHDDVTPITKHGAIGDAYAELGDLSNAESSYKKAIQTENEFLTPYYLNKLAVLATKNGDSKTASSYYSKIVKEYPNSPESKQAELLTVEE